MISGFSCGRVVSSWATPSADGDRAPQGSKGAVNIIFTLYYFNKISHSILYMKMFLIKGRSKKTPAGLGS